MSRSRAYEWGASARAALSGGAAALMLAASLTGIGPAHAASTAPERTSPEVAGLAAAPSALRVGRLDPQFDDFGPPTPGPGLLPLVAGTSADVEMRWRAPARVTAATLSVLLPDAFDVPVVRPQAAVLAPGVVFQRARAGAFTVRPAATFSDGYRPRGHCQPVPGRVPQTATRTSAGWLLTVPGVSCARGQLLRLRVYGVQLPAEPTTVRVPWRLEAHRASALPAGDGGSDGWRGSAEVSVIAPTPAQLVVTAPPTYQLVRDRGPNGQPLRTVHAAPISVTVTVVGDDGSPYPDWTGWITVAPDIRREAYRLSCDSPPQAVRVRASDRGQVVVRGIELIRTSTATSTRGPWTTA